MSTWYLGPYGDLRALECPEVGLSTPVTRYGGVHQGLSGARTVDVTGFKQDIEMSFEFLTQDEFAWMEALHLRHIPGPLFLINPLKKNILSRESTSLIEAQPSGAGISISGGTTEYVTDFPSGVLGSRAVSHDGIVLNDVARFDANRQIPVFGGEQITASIYLKASAAQSVTFVLDAFRADGTQTTSPSMVAAMTTSWSRFSFTSTMASDAVSIQAALVFNIAGTFPEYRFAAPQIERASSASSFALGGGSLKVLIDQIPTSSPLFPMTDATLNLMEA